MKKIIALILALVLCLSLYACGGGATAPSTTEPTFVKPDDYAMVLLVTINPQVRLYIDKDGKVLAVESANKDAEKVIENLDFQHKSYETVITEFIVAANAGGYVNGNARIVFKIVESKDKQLDAEEVLDKAADSANDTIADLEISAEVVCTPYEDSSIEDQTEGALPEETHSHDYSDATCTAPKTCKTCGATEGNAVGHSWNDATCTAPKTCKTCGATEGAASGHNWNDATCTAPKTCKICGATEGNAVGHSWNDATCTAPKTCKTCGATEGNAVGHSWNDATCTAPKTCKTCGATEGNAVGHSWNDATCTAPKTCKTCGATDGAANGHNWQDATCTAPKTCKTCGATDGAANGHNWQDATCTAPKTCKTCGATDGTTLAHAYQDGLCACGARELGVGGWCTYYTAEGTLYKVSISSTGISKTEYMEVEKIPAADLETMIQYGQTPILYEGKIYFPRGGLGDPCYFSDKKDNSIVFNLGFEPDAQLGNWTQKMTLERLDLDKIKVTKMSEPFYNIKEGTVFVYENETDTTLQNWEGNIWRAAVVTENGNFAMEYCLNTIKKEINGYPLTSRGGPRYDTISSDVLGEYPLTFEVDGVKYGDAGDYGGVGFVTFKAERNMVIISDDDVPSIVLCQVNSKQYKVIAHLNKDQNTYPQRCLPVGTVFTLVEE